MKAKFLFILAIGFFARALAQTDGISYQAVIIDNNLKEIPGVDIANSNLPNKPLTVQFTIYGVGNVLEYQESHTTETDAYGMINLMIGTGNSTGASPIDFDQIYWSDEKILKVEIDLNDGNGMVAFNEQKLSYIPYVKHREIVATSTLDVDGVTNLNNDFYVNEGGVSNLSGELNVNNGSKTNLSGELNVNNQSPTLLTGSLNVGGAAELERSLNVQDTSFFQDKVYIKTQSVSGTDNSVASHALQVESLNQGIAVNITRGFIHREQNYVTFFQNGEAKGRIEGFAYLDNLDDVLLTSILGTPDLDDILDGGEENTDPADVPPNTFFANNYTFGAYLIYLELLNSAFTFGVNLGAAIGTGCTVGDCDDALWSFIDMGMAGWQFGAYISYNNETLGVAFESGGADYAEWLLKEFPSENMLYGEIVGVKGGKVSKKWVDAETFMVISHNPTVIGAMPTIGSEKDYAKIAFMGQVPVKVLGQTEVGDYILPSGNGDGFGIAVHPTAMKLGDYKNIVGIAWSASKADQTFSYINTAVGLNRNDVAPQLKKINSLLDRLQRAVAQINPEYKPEYLSEGTSQISRNTQATTTSPSLQQMIAENSGALNATSYTEAFNAVAQETKNAKFDLMQMPFIADAVANPTEENAQKIVDFYGGALQKMKDMQNKAGK